MVMKKYANEHDSETVLSLHLHMMWQTNLMALIKELKNNVYFLPCVSRY